MSEAGKGAEGAGADSPERYALRLRVLGADIDVNGHVNNVVYVRWVQEAATAHWDARTSDAEKAGVAGDEIAAVTWVGPASRNAYERNTELRRASDGELLARARTLWCPLSPATGRPCRLDEGVRARFSTPGPLRARAGD